MSKLIWASRLPIQVMMHSRWDDAFEFLFKRSLSEFGVDLESWLELTRSDDRKSQRQSMLDVIETAFLGKKVELALAWSFLAADPAHPETITSFLPQVATLLDKEIDAETYTDAEAEALRETLNVWMDAAGGGYVDAKVSVFAIADRIVHRVENRDTFDRLRASAEKRGTVDEVSDTTGLVVMPKATSTKLVAETSEWKTMIGKKLPFVMAVDVDQVRSTLRLEYPHAWPAIDMLTKDLREGKPVKMKPAILLGDPGSGKSRLVRRLAQLLGLSLTRFDAGSSSESISWAGTARGWGNTTPSVPARAVRQSMTPNPMVLIDEIGRAGTGWRSGSLYTAITPYLEIETSLVRDLSLDADLDLRFVSYIATANDDTTIPVHIRDRFRIIRVSLPGLQHLRQLAVNIMRDLAAEADVDPRWMAPLDGDEEALIGKVWARVGFSIRNLQKIISATVEARDAHAMRQ